MESFGINVDDKSMKLRAGQQRLTSPEGFVFPLDFSNGLPYLPIRPFTDHEWNTLPHVLLTADTEWDPSVHDMDTSSDQQFINGIPDNPTHLDSNSINTITTHLSNITTHPSFISAPSKVMNINIHPILDELDICYSSFATTTQPSVQDYEKLRHYFLYVPSDIVKRIFKVITQYAKSG